MVEQESAERDECDNDDGGGEGMSGRHPRQPHGQDIFSKTQKPIAEWFGRGVDGGAGAGFCAVRSEGHSAGEQGGGPSPFRRGTSGSGESKESGGGRANEGVQGVPESVEVGNFVREELQKIKRNGDCENPWMRKNLQAGRQVQNAEALEQAERRDSGVKIEAGGKSGA